MHLLCSSYQAPHPIQEEIIQYLRINYHASALFFWNHLQGTMLHVVFKPKALAPQKFTIMKSHWMKLIDDGKQESTELMELNVKEVIANMLSIGNGIIDKVIYH